MRLSLLVALTWLPGLFGCAETAAWLGTMQVQQTAHRHCEQMPSMEQRNQCLRNMDTTLPQDSLRLRPLPGSAMPQPAPEPSEQEQVRRREALCIRREGQAPLCPN